MAQGPLQHGTGSCPCKSDSFSFVLDIEKAVVSLFSAGVMTGFDAAGHVAEETKNARLGQVIPVYSNPP